MAATPKPSLTPRVQHGDMIMTFEEVCDMIRRNENQLYKLNAQLAFPVYKRGKRCFYLYSEVANWFLNTSAAIAGKSSLQRELSVDELPKLWPMFRADGTPTTPAERDSEREAARKIRAAGEVAEEAA